MVVGGPVGMPVNIAGADSVWLAPQRAAFAVARAAVRPYPAPPAVALGGPSRESSPMLCVRPAGLALLFAFAPAPVFADSLVAVSTTAMAITGDIQFDDFSIVFENGEELVFDELLGDSFNVDGARVGASVYSIKTPADPVLNNGNFLCGQGKVTYLASWGDAADDALTIIAVFDTQDVPGSDAEMCASYTYAYE